MRAPFASGARRYRVRSIRIDGGGVASRAYVLVWAEGSEGPPPARGHLAGRREEPRRREGVGRQDQDGPPRHQSGTEARRGLVCPSALSSASRPTGVPSGALV